MMLANPEYLAVLSEVVDCLRTTLHHEKLRDLTPEEVVDWLHSLTVKDVKAVWRDPLFGNQSE